MDIPRILKLIDAMLTRSPKDQLQAISDFYADCMADIVPYNEDASEVLAKARKLADQASAIGKKNSETTAMKYPAFKAVFQGIGNCETCRAAINHDGKGAPCFFQKVKKVWMLWCPKEECFPTDVAVIMKRNKKYAEWLNNTVSAISTLN